MASELTTSAARAHAQRRNWAMLLLMKRQEPSIKRMLTPACYVAQSAHWNDETAGRNGRTSVGRKRNSDRRSTTSERRGAEANSREGVRGRMGQGRSRAAMTLAGTILP